MTDTGAIETGRAPRPEKVAIVDEVRSRLEGSSAALLTEYRGLKVSELATLRTALTAAGGDLKIYKNTLVRFAVRDLGIDLDEAMLVGPTAIAFVDGDAAAVAKALRDYARTNPNLVVKGGVLGSSALSAAEARALADLPSRDVLLARLAGGLAAPLVGFAGLLQALPRNLAYGLKALIDKGGDPAGQTGAAPAPVAEDVLTEGPAALATGDLVEEIPAVGAAPIVDDAPADGAPAADPATPAPVEGAFAAGDPTEAAPDPAVDAAPEILAAAPAEGAPVVSDVLEGGPAGGAAPVTDEILADAPAEGAPAAGGAPVASSSAPAGTSDAEPDAEVAPAAEVEITGAAPAAEADTEGEATPAETTDTPEEAS